MSPVFENPSLRDLDQKELLDEVGKHDAGIDALTLAKAFVAGAIIHMPFSALSK